MTDDKQHEYVPPALADVGDVREQLAVMTGEAADLAVLLRVTEARLAVVTAERDAARQPLNAARQWAAAWKCKMKRERASYRTLLRAHIPLIEQCRRGTNKRDELRADLKITSRKLNAELVRGVGLEQQLAALKAEREILIAKIASMANERDMFAAKVNQDMDELVAATAEMVRAISDLPRH